MTLADGGKVWIDAHRPDDRWKRLRHIGSGGQAKGYAAERLDGVDHDMHFLKVLREQTNPERRARMFREAAALSTYSHPRIPRLIESNAHRHEDHTFELYIVMQFVEGKPLSESRGRPIPLPDALAVTDQIAEVVEYLQGTDAIHRDIKPDNIILRGGRIDAVLVDFGMTFNNAEPPSFATTEWQEVGNRFLRLPELSSYSLSKRDIRSDFAFLTGILFFCLFGHDPAILVDENGYFPHQRVRESLASVCPDAASARRLAGFFDRGFQSRLS